MIEIQNPKVPEPTPGEIRVKLKMTGICGSDVHIYSGHRLLGIPMVLGHEGLGFIDKLGQGVTNRSVGQRVVVEPNIPCLSCHFCLSGRGNICPDKKVVGLNRPGCFARYVVVPANFCWPIPDEVSDHDAVTIEPTAVGLHALFQSKARPGDSIAVVGLGAIGLLLTHLALSLGYRVVVSDLNSKKIKLAADLGAVPVGFDRLAENELSLLRDTWLDHRVETIFECTGVATAVNQTLEAAPRGAEVILLGLSEKEVSFKPLQMVRDGIHIVPSLIYNHPNDFRRTIQLVINKIISPGFVISTVMPFAKIQDALSLAAKGTESKVAILNEE